MEIDEVYLTLRAMQIIDFGVQWQNTTKYFEIFLAKIKT